MTTFKVGDRVRNLQVNLCVGPPLRATGTVIGVLQRPTGTLMEYLVEFDKEFLGGRPATARITPFGTSGRCWTVFDQNDGGRSPLEPEGEMPDREKSVGIPPGYTKTSEGFLTNPDNWKPGKWLL